MYVAINEFVQFVVTGCCPMSIFSVCGCGCSRVPVLMCPHLRRCAHGELTQEVELLCTQMSSKLEEKGLRDGNYKGSC